jgi:hypothetical protein
VPSSADVLYSSQNVFGKQTGCIKRGLSITLSKFSQQLVVRID